MLKLTFFIALLASVLCAAAFTADDGKKAAEAKGKNDKAPAAADSFEPPDGENASSVQVGNLIYAGVRSSVCFSDHFLQLAETNSSISTSRRFHAVKTSSTELFKYPFVIMTGEGAFKLLADERANLKKFLEGGGFLLASAGCSSADWDRSFRVEMGEMFKDKPLKGIPLAHKIFKTVFEISEIKVRHGKPKALEGVEINGRLAVVYSPDGLNDTGHVHGCCCCGGNEISNCAQINVNLLAYALTH